MRMSGKRLPNNAILHNQAANGEIPSAEMLQCYFCFGAKSNLSSERNFQQRVGSTLLQKDQQNGKFENLISARN